MEDMARQVFEGNQGINVAAATAGKWAPIPKDADEWCVALHHLVSKAYGDGLQCGERAPQWKCNNDGEFLADEEERRGLPSGALMPFLELPYYDTLTTAEYTKGKKKATLFGTGEKFGDWDAYHVFYVNASAQATTAQLQSMVVGQKVDVNNECETATFVRVLRSTKPVESSEDGGKTQQCFYALLHDGQCFRYASLQCASPSPTRTQYSGPGPWTCGEFDRDWIEEGACAGFLMERTMGESKLLRFRAKSVSAVAKAAPKYAANLKRARSPSSGARGSDED